MVDAGRIISCTLAMALTTYLIRMLPLLLVKKKIENEFVLSLLHYLPYAVLSAMTVPAVFYRTDGPIEFFSIPMCVGFVAAVLLAWYGKNLMVVAFSSCVVVYLVELMI